MDTVPIGELIRKKRKEKGITQAELAEAAGISLPSITKYELGDRIPKMDALLKLDKVLDLGISPALPSDISFPPSSEKEKNTELPKIKELLLSENFNFLPQEEIDELIQDIDNYTEEFCSAPTESGDVQKVINHEKEITHRIFDDIMNSYDEQPIFDIVKVLTGYLSLDYDGKTLLLDVLESFCNNKKLIQKNYDPSDPRPLSCRRKKTVQQQYLQNPTQE